MTFDGTGTRNSPIFIQDSEEEIIQEISYQQFYGSSSSNDTTQSANYSTHQPSSMAGKRKSREEDEFVADAHNNAMAPSTSLENRISQPESKKSRKRRRRAQRNALERNKLQSIDWLDNRSYPPGPSQPTPPLHARLEAERQYSDFLEGVLRLENQANMVFHDLGPPSPSTFDSDWVSSMVIAGEFPHCKKVKTSSKVSPRPAPRPLPISPSLPPPEVLPPIHIHPDLVVSTEAPQTIGMKPDQDPNSKHGIFHITDLTKESGSGMKNRESPYTPNPSRTLVMETLPKTHRTTEFVDDWCRAASGAPPLHLFIDPPSAKALIEFDTAELARKAWASPRLGWGLLGRKSHLLKGIPREDQIKVWWYRVDGVGEIEEGEVEEDANHMQVTSGPPSSPRKESKKERNARLAKQRESKAMKENQQQQRTLKNVENSSNLVSTISQPSPSVSVSTPAQVQATSSQGLAPTPEVIPPLPALPFDPTIGSLHPPAQPWPYPFAQSASQVPPLTKSSYPTPSSCSTAVGSSLAPGAHDDSASIASSGGRSSPECRLSKQTAVVVPSSKIVVIATTVGQADDLADYCEVDVDSVAAPPRSSEKATSPTAIQRQQPSTKDSALERQPVIPAKPITSRKLREEARSKQQSQARPHPRSHFARTSTPANVHRSVPPFVFKGLPSRQPQQRSPLSSTSAASTPATVHRPSMLPFVFKSLPSRQLQQRSPLSSTPSPSTPISTESFPLVPIPAAHTSKTSEPKITPNIVHSERAASVRSKLEQQISRSGMELVATGNPTTPASSHSAPSPVSIAPAFVAPSSRSSDSVGQAMEENLRQLVFASKRARVSGIQPHSPPSQCRSSTLADANMTSPVHHVARKVLPANDGPSHAQAKEINEVASPNLVSAPSSAIASTSNSTSLNQPSTTDTYSDSFEDLAITFITQTIENVKANNNNQPRPDPQSVDSSLGSTLTSASPPPSDGAVVDFSTLPSGFASSDTAAADATLDKLPLSSSSSANLSRSELSAKHRRLEKHLQESKCLMEQLSTAKTKREKDLLLKIMNEKMRLFEEENKASEKKTATTLARPSKSKMTSTTVLQFRQWPTTQSDPVLVLSDDED